MYQFPSTHITATSALTIHSNLKTLYTRLCGDIPVSERGVQFVSGLDVARYVPTEIFTISYLTATYILDRLFSYCFWKISAEAPKAPMPTRNHYESLCPRERRRSMIFFAVSFAEDLVRSSFFSLPQ